MLHQRLGYTEQTVYRSPLSRFYRELILPQLGIYIRIQGLTVSFVYPTHSKSILYHRYSGPGLIDEISCAILPETQLNNMNQEI